MRTNDNNKFGIDGRSEERERERGRRGGKGGRRLPRPRPCSVVGRRALESGLYLTPNQLRSAVPDKVSSPLPPRVANSERTARITRRHRPGWLKATSLGCHSRGRPANTKSPGAKCRGGGGGGSPPAASSCSPSLAFLHLSSHSSFSSMACMHPGNELSLATL